MIPGYNHNVKYKDKVYHVQTEDSGVENPHIITHLFVGGNIIESRKTSYADIVKNANRDEMLVELMQDQHKTMLKELISGRFDSKIAQRSVNAATLNGPAPLNVDAGAQHRASSFFGAGIEAPKAKPAAPAAPASAAVPPPAPPKAVEPVRPTPPALPQRPPVAAKPAAPAAPSVFGAPPPPAPAPAVQAQSERIIEAETLQRVFDSKNDSAVDSIFGGDLISEKSLDEVILSYLAEDMQKE